MNIVLLGAPGSGKGTQARFIQENHGMSLISMGNILREEVRNQTSFGQEIKSLMEQGLCAPDDLVLEIFEENFEKILAHGALLDGIPRTLYQARQIDERLDKRGTQIDFAIHLAVNDQVVIDRLSQRRVCQECGEPYAPDAPSQKEGVCDRCMGTLVRRKDDDPEVVRVRLNVYNEQTDPVIAYYRETGRLRIVDGMGPVNTVAEQINLFF